MSNADTPSLLLKQLINTGSSLNAHTGRDHKMFALANEENTNILFYGVMAALCSYTLNEISMLLKGIMPINS